MSFAVKLKFEKRGCKGMASDALTLKQIKNVKRKTIINKINLKLKNKLYIYYEVILWKRIKMTKVKIIKKIKNLK